MGLLTNVFARLPIPGAITGRLALLARPAVLAAIGAFFGVVVLVSLIGTILRPSAAAEPEPPASSPVFATPVLDDRAAPTAVPPTSTPALTPTPVSWERRGESWLGIGWESGERRLSPLQLERREPPFRVSTSITVLTASGGFSPVWAMVLSYHNADNYVMIESYRRSERGQSWMGMFLVKRVDGKGEVIGDHKRYPEFRWGRDTHRMDVDVRPLGPGLDEVAVTFDSEPGLRYPVRGAPWGGRVGMWVAGNSRIRFDDIQIS